MVCDGEGEEVDKGKKDNMVRCRERRRGVTRDLAGFNFHYTFGSDDRKHGGIPKVMGKGKM